ncbi:hypothetical protein [Streptomyces sp. WAC 01325]|uniref:YqeB family protein n=1 Tax=Streptomyces sp. WAC 01325 TaxID=2203202 RepID=UPI00163C91EE|nr:hypothetical protein [Streptomyces sp. WAC 01325]
MPEPWQSVGSVGVGAVLGLVVGFIAVHESLSVRVSADRVVLGVRDSSQDFGRDRIGLVVRDGKQLVLLGPDGMEIAREECGLPWARLAEAFAAHGYRWADEDPHLEEFRRWVPGMPGLPDGADALLRARAAAREKDAGADDARELRGELSRLGVVVRDEKGRQYWRTWSVFPRGSVIGESPDSGPRGSSSRSSTAVVSAEKADRMAATVLEEGG